MSVHFQGASSARAHQCAQTVGNQRSRSGHGLQRVGSMGNRPSLGHAISTENQNTQQLRVHHTVGLRGSRKMTTALFNRRMRKTARPVVWELWRAKSRQGHPIWLRVRAAPCVRFSADAPVGLTCSLPLVAPCGLPPAVSRAAALAAWVPPTHSTFPGGHEALSRWRCSRPTLTCHLPVAAPLGLPAAVYLRHSRACGYWGMVARQRLKLNALTCGTAESQIPYFVPVYQ